GAGGIRRALTPFRRAREAPQGLSARGIGRIGDGTDSTSVFTTRDWAWPFRPTFLAATCNWSRFEGVPGYNPGEIDRDPSVIPARALLQERRHERTKERFQRQTQASDRRRH